MTDECPHYCDNQGLCHRCGIMMEPQLWDWYVNGYPVVSEPVKTIKLRVPARPRKKKPKGAIE